MSKNFYVTTPIYYVNDAPHIGHAYTTVLADVVSRYHALCGYNTYMQTGTDEHGQKIQQVATARKIDPKAHVDEYNLRFKNLWSKLEINYDNFIRTTNKDHIAYVQDRLQQLFDKGEIYTKEYSGWYSVGEERFFAEEELVNGKDPISNRDVDWISEKNYFFKMSNYQDRLIKYIDDNPDFIMPNFRKNEVLGFLRQELTDLCISRPKSRLAWGIPLPFDQDYVTYVWFDALLNYISGVDGVKHADGSSVWPATYHLIGKDILTTHCVYWTTMMMAMDIEMPKHILAHGWWLNDGAKMSKSSGTAINPIPYMDAYGVDNFRYFLIRDMVIGQDASFCDDNFFQRSNNDLANDLGNGLNRVHKQILTHFNGIIPEIKTIPGSEEIELEKISQEIIDELLELIQQMRLSQLAEDIFKIVRSVNKYLEQKAPWKLAKDENKRDELSTVLYYSAEAIRLALTMLEPIIPGKAREGLKMLGVEFEGAEGLHWGSLKPGSKIGEGQALFPRIIPPETEEEKVAKEALKNCQKLKKQQQNIHPLSKLDFKVAEILEVCEHPDADSLYLLKVNLGDEERTICSGLKNHYQPEDLKGLKVVLFANLKSSKIRGIESHGMVLAADGDNGEVILIKPDQSLKAGQQLQFGELPVVPKSQVKIKEFQKQFLVLKGGFVNCQDFDLHALDNLDKKIICDGVSEGAKVH